MEFDIDARGLSCPRPVIMTKEALSDLEGPFTILVDNEASRDNVARFSRSSGCEVEVSDHENGYVLTITPTGEAEEKGETKQVIPPGSALKTVIFFGADEIGRGDRELGTTLAKAFLYACTENDNRPTAMVFMNSGVRLVTENEETVEHVKRLQAGGVEIVVCGTCLDYYDLGDELKVGRVSNMYEIQSILISADRLVSV